MSDSRPIVVTHDADDRFSIRIGDHVVLTDQPPDDAGPSPTELFIASLVACMAFFARRFLDRNGLDTSGLTVAANTEWATDKPRRVGTIDIVIDAPEMDEKLMAGLRRTVEHCTVHNSLLHPPQINTVWNTTA